MADVDVERFAREWIAAWNSHDLEAILAHYASEIVFLSPLARKRTGDGRVVGIERLSAYWAAGLQLQPDLRFELVEVLRGDGAATIRYRNHRGESVAETLEFGADGKVVRGYACYAV